MVITEALVALRAFAARAMFMAAPSGWLMGMTEATLARSPFGNYLVPGIVLFVVVGGTQTLAAWADLRRWPRAGWLSVVAGAVLAGWIAAGGDDRFRPPDAAEPARGGRGDRGAGADAAAALGVM